MTDTAEQTRPTCAAPLLLRGVAGLGVLGASWLAMMAVHELGHVLAAWSTGGSVERVVLPWLGFSRTDVSPNPRPLLVAWAGPVMGVAVPTLGWAAARCWLKPAEPSIRFFAGWCLLCNGAYLGLGWIDRVGDTGDLLRHGAAVWQLVAFGVACATAGLWLWHGLGRGMGLRDARAPSCRILVVTAAGVVAVYALLQYVPA